MSDPNTHYISTVCTIIVALMLLQHWLIGRSVNEDAWEKKLRLYRNIMRMSVGFPAIFVIVVCLILLMDYQTGGEFGTLRSLMAFLLHKEGAVSILFLAFFAGVLRLFAERALGGDETILGSLRDVYRSFVDHNRMLMESTVGRISGVIGGRGSDAWFGWLVVSLCLTFLNAVLDSPMEPTSLPQTAAAESNLQVNRATDDPPTDQLHGRDIASRLWSHMRCDRDTLCCLWILSLDLYGSLFNVDAKSSSFKSRCPTILGRIVERSIAETKPNNWTAACGQDILLHSSKYGNHASQYCLAHDTSYKRHRH